MKKNLIGKIAAICLLLAGIIVIITMFCDNRYEWTDDAQVEQYISPVNVKVSGYIREIRFTEHQHVRKGRRFLPHAVRRAQRGDILCRFRCGSGLRQRMGIFVHV